MTNLIAYLTRRQDRRRSSAERSIGPLQCGCGKPATHGLGLGTQSFRLFCDEHYKDFVQAWGKKR